MRLTAISAVRRDRPLAMDLSGCQKQLQLPATRGTRLLHSSSFFFFNDTATTEIYTLSLHDALPISRSRSSSAPADPPRSGRRTTSAPSERSRSRCCPTTSSRCCSRASSTRRRRSPSSTTDRKSTRLNSSHSQISYAVFCLKKKNTNNPSADFHPAIFFALNPIHMHNTTPMSLITVCKHYAPAPLTHPPSPTPIHTATVGSRCESLDTLSTRPRECSIKGEKSPNMSATPERCQLPRGCSTFRLRWTSTWKRP